MGPANASESPLLLGEGATIGTVLVWLYFMAQADTEYLLFYFSGHGSEEGIELADGTLTYRALHEALQQFSTKPVLVILDACHSGTYGKIAEVSGVGSSWAELLAKAMPGTRMFFAARSDETTSEGGGVPGGRLTWTLLEVLRMCMGAMRQGDHQFVADDEAFYTTYARMAQRWPQDTLPESRNLVGDFPMLQSYVAQNFGRTSSLHIATTPRVFGIDVATRVIGFPGKMLDIRYQLLDQRWKVIKGQRHPFVPQQHIDVSGHSLSVTGFIWPYDVKQAFESGSQVTLRWAAQLVDPMTNALLGAATTSGSYSLPRSANRWAP